MQDEDGDEVHLHQDESAKNRLRLAGTIFWLYKLLLYHSDGCHCLLTSRLFFFLRDVPSSAALPVIRPLGRQQSISVRGKHAMQEYLNHFLGNLDIVNSREVYFYNLFLWVGQLLYHSLYLVLPRFFLFSVLARNMRITSEF